MGTPITNNTPLNIIIFFRPNKSASVPAKSVEKTAPSKTAATIKESSLELSSEVASRYGSAPEMMPTSTP